ncbi:MAG TPA: TIGR03767 family metallophosphoesterase [Frankiaceae bacterium]|nr:TIGR03767 family metallophosphoesterase [Frankiaceae bacterium]
MRPSRRDVLRAASVSGAAFAAPPLFFPSRRAPFAPLDPRGTTLDRTILRSPAELRSGGYRLLVSGPGEPHIVRDDLGATANAARVTRRKPVTSFVQFTDVHVLDAQSPARVEFLDRYSDAPGQQVPFDSAWRPQEALTLQLADSLVRAVRAVKKGPVTGRPFEFTICTGDNTDNAQLNETRWFVDVLDGRLVSSDSGDPARYEGVQDGESTTYDVHYWHPDGTPSGKTPDNGHRLYGFPTVTGLLEQARKPFAAAGIGMPWYCVFGNHDPLLQGNAPAFYHLGGQDVPTGFANVATGPVKIVSLPAGLSPGDAQRGLMEQDPAVLNALLNAPARTVTADPNRRPLTKREIMAEMFETTGTPVGHGFGQDNVSSGKGYYAFDSGQFLRCVVLDTVNPGGYSEGSIDREQFEWLEAELTANAQTRRLAVVFSHHPVAGMTNPILAVGETAPRVLGPAVVELLLRFPHVILWVNGHTHRNDVVPHAGGGGGFWEVNTAAHIDFPNQSRIVEIVDNLDGTLSIFGTIVDALAPLTYSSAASYTAPGDPAALAAIAREVAANDWQSRPADLNGGRRGSAETRNVELVVKAPFDLGLGGGNGGGRGAVGGGSAGRPRTGPRIPDTGPDDLPASVAAALAVAAAGLAAARRRATGTAGDTTEDA